MIIYRTKYFSKAELNRFKGMAGEIFDGIKNQTSVSKDDFINTLTSLRKRRRREAANEIRKLKNGNPDEYKKYLKIRDEERVGNNKYLEKYKNELNESADSGDWGSIAAAMKLPVSSEKYNKKAIDSCVLGDGINRFRNSSRSINNYTNTKRKQPVYVNA